MRPADDEFKPYIADESRLAEFTPKAVFIGIFFGILFGASTVYLALRAGLTVSASIPIAVLSISVLKRFGGSTILENNIVQTVGSAGESIASGVVFTLPGFLFLARDAAGVSVGAASFTYGTIFTLALLGGMLGVLMMVPLRRALIVQEHGTLPYPEGTACASVLIAGEKGGAPAKTAFQGLGFAFAYALVQKVLKVIAETPSWVSRSTSTVLPAATFASDITPEYLGVGYIIGPRIGGVLVAGGVLAWLGLIPLLASLVSPDAIAAQLVKLGYLADLTKAGAYGWSPATHTFGELNRAIYFAYVRQIGAGAVATGGLMTLLRTLPSIVAAFRGSVAMLKDRGAQASQRRTERDLPMSVVLIGSVLLVLVVTVLPFVPGTPLGKLALGVMIVVFGFFFVTVSSRIVGVIGTSSNPVSGMTIATLMATCLIFVGLGWTGDIYQPMALSVGAMVCIAAANAGATSQDLKTGYLIGSTPRYQQIGLVIGAVAAAAVIGLTMRVLDNPTLDPATGLITHAIGSEKFPAPQGTLMATLVRGLLARNLDWQFVLVGAALAVTIQLCGVSALSFAVGAYLPLSTTLPIFVGGMIKGLVDWRKGQLGGTHADDELGPGNLFSTGLVAGGSLAGVLIAIVVATADRLKEKGSGGLQAMVDGVSLENALTGALGHGGYDLLGVACFALMGAVLYRVARRGNQHEVEANRPD